ncbi:unnamed protein product [Toxocara canis]|uniref:Secreted protein n=1 Tax=Toxocara canis TaxID=6265 RepID=A0A183VG64_TOXCA|nr:unnamed protein product [Toxocara canis]
MSVPKHKPASMQSISAAWCGACIRRDHINAPYLRLMTGIAAPLGNEMKPTTKCVSFRVVIGDAAAIMVVQPLWVRTLSR